MGAPKVTVTSARTWAAGVAPVSGSTPLGRSTATTSAAPGVPAGGSEATRLAAGSRSPGRPAETDDAVDDEVGLAAGGARRPAAGSAEPAAGGAQGGGTRRVDVRGEGDRGHPDAAAGEPGAGPQRVAAVVAGADEEDGAGTGQARRGGP